MPIYVTTGMMRRQYKSGKEDTELNSLLKAVNDCQVVSVVGTCKNAGKTTVLNYLLSHFDHCVNAVSSIGRDGESQDVVTLTAKPDIYVKKGTLIATAHNLLPCCTITQEIVSTTPFNTPLGAIVIVRALSDGYIQIAGPSQVQQMIQIKDMFIGLGAQRIFIDGAISRLSPCTTALSQATVLVTGASYDIDIDRVVNHTAYITRLLTLNRVNSNIANIIDARNRSIYSGSQNAICLDSKGAIVECDTYQAMYLPTEKLKYVYINGALTDKIISTAVKSPNNQQHKTIIVDDSSKILINQSSYEYAMCRLINIEVIHDVNLALICTNPVSAYGYNFDANTFCVKVKQLCSNICDVPIIDVMRCINE
ncbi:MAG: hypothetical protein PHW00_06045 [Clostridia bacterium]|nr:hypothetical protein [Clostridia bacterium]